MSDKQPGHVGHLAAEESFIRVNLPAGSRTQHLLGREADPSVVD
jgi:hypothetical protein